MSPAILYLGDEVLSNGQAALPRPDARGLFVPYDERSLNNCPSHGVTLRMSGKDHAIAIYNLELCDAALNRVHYHFSVVEEKA